MGRGKTDQVQTYTERVLHLAREITELRIALREGRGGEIGKQAEAIALQTTKLLAEIRSAT